MTLTADYTQSGGARSDERRGRALGPRHSWAAAEPYTRPAAERGARVEPPADERWSVALHRYRRAALEVDGALTALAVGCALGGSAATPASSLGVGVALAGLMLVLVAVNGGYCGRSVGDGPVEFQAILRAGTTLAGLLMVAAYAAHADVPRLLVFVGVPAAMLGSAVGRYVLRQRLHRTRSTGLAMMTTLLVGDGPAVERVGRDLSGSPHHGYQVIGICLPSVDHDPPDLFAPVVGAIADVPQVVVERAVDVVIVTGSYLSGDALRRLSWALSRTGADLVVAPGLVEVAGPRLSVQPTAGLSLLRVEIDAPRSRLVAKALMDRVLGLALLVASGPVVLGAALAVALTSPGGAFYRQTRIGVDGVEFTLWKLRSMFQDADRRRDELNARSEGAGVLFKMRHDPRITPIGHLIRRLSIDELPQLWNVVRGDMSLVGPRPPLAAEVERYPDAVRRRLHVKPGLTGLWQVSGRSDLDWDEAVRLDLRYVDNWSVAMDLMILWKTARAVLTGVGAY